MSEEKTVTNVTNESPNTQQTALMGLDRVKKMLEDAGFSIARAGKETINVWRSEGNYRLSHLGGRLGEGKIRSMLLQVPDLCVVDVKTHDNGHVYAEFYPAPRYVPGEIVRYKDDSQRLDAPGIGVKVLEYREALGDYRVKPTHGDDPEFFALESMLVVAERGGISINDRDKIPAGVHDQHKKEREALQKSLDEAATAQKDLFKKLRELEDEMGAVKSEKKKVEDEYDRTRRRLLQAETVNNTQLGAALKTLSGPVTPKFMVKVGIPSKQLETHLEAGWDIMKAHPNFETGEWAVILSRGRLSPRNQPPALGTRPAASRLLDDLPNIARTAKDAAATVDDSPKRTDLVS